MNVPLKLVFVNNNLKKLVFTVGGITVSQKLFLAAACQANGIDREKVKLWDKRVVASLYAKDEYDPNETPKKQWAELQAVIPNCFRNNTRNQIKEDPHDKMDEKYGEPLTKLEDFEAALKGELVQKSLKRKRPSGSSKSLKDSNSDDTPQKNKNKSNGTSKSSKKSSSSKSSKDSSDSLQKGNISFDLSSPSANDNDDNLIEPSRKKSKSKSKSQINNFDGSSTSLDLDKSELRSGGERSILMDFLQIMNTHNDTIKQGVELLSAISQDLSKFVRLYKKGHKTKTISPDPLLTSSNNDLIVSSTVDEE